VPPHHEKKGVQKKFRKTRDGGEENGGKLGLSRLSGKVQRGKRGRNGCGCNRRLLGYWGGEEKVEGNIFVFRKGRKGLVKQVRRKAFAALIEGLKNRREEDFVRISSKEEGARKEGGGRGGVVQSLSPSLLQGKERKGRGKPPK